MQYAKFGTTSWDGLRTVGWQRESTPCGKSITPPSCCIRVDLQLRRYEPYLNQWEKNSNRFLILWVLHQADTTVTVTSVMIIRHMVPTRSPSPSPMIYRSDEHVSSEPNNFRRSSADCLMDGGCPAFSVGSLEFRVYSESKRDWVTSSYKIDRDGEGWKGQRKK